MKKQLTFVLAMSASLGLGTVIKAETDLAPDPPLLNQEIDIDSYFAEAGTTIVRHDEEDFDRRSIIEKEKRYDYHPEPSLKKERGYPRGGMHWGGPRIGVTYLGDGRGAEKLKSLVAEKFEVELDPYLTQFGWQFEYRMFRTEDGLTALTEFVPMIAGLEQGLALPSANILLGVRTPGGFEMGFGPHIGMKGVGLTLATGYTVKAGGLNFPINLVANLSNQTTAISLVTGFNLQRD